MRDASVPDAGPWRVLGGPGPLSGVRVVDFGQYIAGPMAAMLLADQGADVIRIDPPGGPRWQSPANTALLRGRRSIVLDLADAEDRARAQALVESADVLIENFRPGAMARWGLDPAACTARNPRLIYCSLPGFSRHDPRAQVPAWEGVVMAAGGAYAPLPSMLENTGDPADVLPPLFTPVPLASVLAAMEAAMGVAAALVARERDQTGQVVEAPLFDALLEASSSRAMTFERHAPRFSDFGSGVYRCADGRMVTFLANWFRHLRLFVEAAGRQAWIADGLVDLHALREDPQLGVELRRRLVELFASRDAREWEALAQASGCTVGMLRTAQEWLAEPAAVESGAVTLLDDPDRGRTHVPGLAVEVEPFGRAEIRPPRPVGTDTDAIVRAIDQQMSGSSRRPLGSPPQASAGPRRPALAGVRVLDLSRVVAAPTTAKLLGQWGADVVKIDADPSKSEASFEEPALHEHLNRGKRTAIVDLHSDEGRQVFSRLVSRSDVLVQNFTVGTDERLGTDERTVREQAPDIVSVYLNTFGTRGPWAGVRGFAEIANVTSGLTDHVLDGRTPRSGSDPTIDAPRWFYTDYATGLLGAFGALIGLYGRSQGVANVAVETSLVRATMLEQISWIVGSAVPEAEATAVDAGEPFGQRPWQRLYQAADGWVFVGATPGQFVKLCRCLDLDTDDREVAELEVELEQVLAAGSMHERERAFRDAGSGFHPVVRLDEVMAPGGPAEALGLRLVDRTEDFGVVAMAGPVVRMSATPMIPGDFPGRFGADLPALLDELDDLDERV
ncbi:MAG: CoA transferase [Aeromicrobium sp.]